MSVLRFLFFHVVMALSWFVFIQCINMTAYLLLSASKFLFLRKKSPFCGLKMSRFAMAVDVLKKQDELRNKNTNKSNKIAVDLFREYLSQVQAPLVEFESFSEEELDEHLTAFFLRVRTTVGELYKKFPY